ncbi:hypothetical protein mRhiFer1_010012 [Rhinolophus ferrumequinum]|uniref:Uncharacterized protein n=1 Tax=Rhinolophus ferrumequinum TaxID=59479 RepID=A0A7J7Y5K1_RHIFE|nr:hypothetical protein mRhiFer1_010012 [Rhinolophus ferrumequinum]
MHRLIFKARYARHTTTSPDEGVKEFYYKVKAKSQSSEIINPGGISCSSPGGWRTTSTATPSSAFWGFEDFTNNSGKEPIGIRVNNTRNWSRIWLGAGARPWYEIRCVGARPTCAKAKARLHIL